MYVRISVPVAQRIANAVHKVEGSTRPARTGHSPIPQPSYIFARITDQDTSTGACSWVRAQPQTGGSFQENTDLKGYKDDTGYSSSDQGSGPAFDINGCLNILYTNVYTYVRLWPAIEAPCWLFEYQPGIQNAQITADLPSGYCDQLVSCYGQTINVVNPYMNTGRCQN